MKNSFSKIINDLKSLTKHLEELQDGTNENKSDEEDKKTEKVITIEEVRAVLAEKSREGKVKEVKALIQKHGAEKLTALNPDCYKEILKEAEEL